MPDSNAFLQSVVRDAQTVCTEKFNLATTSLGPDNPDLKAVKTDLDRIFSTLSKPGFWLNDIDADSTPIVTQVIILGSVDVGHLDGVVGKIRQTLVLIETDILIPGLASSAASTTVPSGMNAQVLNALRMTRQQIAIRLQNFAQAGQDLTQDPDFIERQTLQDQLVASYREKLKKNLIASKQSHVDILRNNGNAIQASTSKTAFFNIYDTISSFIQLKVGAP